MHHICLVSEQPLPNFLPSLHPKLKPDTVTLVVSVKMKDRALWLRHELEARQIQVTDDISVKDASDVRELLEIFIKWLDEHNTEDVFLNVTGGTKPMAIAAQEAFRMADKPVFYVDIATDTVTWLNSQHDQIQLDKKLSLKTLFGLNGIKILSETFRSSVENDKWQTFSKMLATNLNMWESALAKLNELATKAEENNSLYCGKVEGNVPETWQKLLTELYGNELIKNENTLCFTSEDARRFCNGAWLEYLVFESIKKIGFTAGTAGMNVVIQDFKGNKNELDAALIFGNSLYVIECKTKNMQRGTKADDAVYKLAELKRLGGLRAQGILVSYRPLRDEDKRRAKAYGVHVIDNLDRLDELLRASFFNAV